MRATDRLPERVYDRNPRRLELPHVARDSRSNSSSSCGIPRSSSPRVGAPAFSSRQSRSYSSVASTTTAGCPRRVTLWGSPASELRGVHHRAEFVLRILQGPIRHDNLPLDDLARLYSRPPPLARKYRASPLCFPADGGNASRSGPALVGCRRIERKEVRIGCDSYDVVAPPSDTAVHAIRMLVDRSNRQRILHLYTYRRILRWHL